MPIGATVRATSSITKFGKTLVFMEIRLWNKAKQDLSITANHIMHVASSKL